MNTYYPFLQQGKSFEHITEPYVCSPPALYIINSASQTFCLGTKIKCIDTTDKLKGAYQFNVLMNGLDTGHYASKIEKQGNRVRILTREGWLVWNGRSFT